MLSLVFRLGSLVKLNSSAKSEFMAPQRPQNSWRVQGSWRGPRARRQTVYQQERAPYRGNQARQASINQQSTQYQSRPSDRDLEIANGQFEVNRQMESDGRIRFEEQGGALRQSATLLDAPLGSRGSLERINMRLERRRRMEQLVESGAVCPACASIFLCVAES